MAVTDRWHKSRPAPGEPLCEHKLAPTSAHGKGDRWQARWRDETGKQCAKLFARKADAERYAAQTATDLARGAYVDPRAGRLPFREYARQWLKAQPDGPSKRAAESRLDSRILPELGGYQLSRIQPSVLCPWLAQIGRDLAPNTVRAVYGVVAQVVQAAADDGLVTASPCQARTLKLPRKPATRIVPWTAAQVAAVADEIGKPWQAAVRRPGQRSGCGRARSWH